MIAGARYGHTNRIAHDCAKVTWVHFTDPEGYVIELQSWNK
jgi:hypothetical protein